MDDALRLCQGLGQGARGQESGPPGGAPGARRLRHGQHPGRGGQQRQGRRGGFLEQLWGRHGGPLNVIWDNAPAHRGEAVRGLLRKPGLNLRLLNLPGYSPDFNADEAVWGWAREEVTGNLCLGNRTAVQDKIGGFLAKLVNRPDEVRRRCRTVLQSRAESLQRDSQPNFQTTGNAHPTLALV